ncbi:MAG: Nif3-like dinuclear metal center hexameric protein [Chitinispirillales bacterium]|jgi:dinuclear metal center YbgI/SA1388 family protein|nr:Nif3-like dinuclear metal center hexameric protein [Chitinispirillales bacterium]
MTSRSEISAYLDKYLSVAEIDDSSFNGLQVEGKEYVSKIAFAVDAGIEVFEKAKQENADILIVHHGLFWKKDDSRFIGMNKKRIDTLISADINLYAVHLPLDMHCEVGNNVEIIKIVGANVSGRFLKHGSGFVGATGKYGSPKSVLQIAEIIEDKLKTKPYVLDEKRIVSVIAAASGACSSDAVIQAKEAGADLLITGEKRDFYHLANDLGISMIFAGHHASEQTGIWALKKHISVKFPDIECVYIECPTGL